MSITSFENNLVTQEITKVIDTALYVNNEFLEIIQSIEIEML